MWNRSAASQDRLRGSEPLSHSADVIIVGQGLAGTTLAWHLLERGLNILILDAKLASASSVAAGLVTPVTGQALRCAPGFARDLRRAAAFYKGIEALVKHRLWYEQEALRVAQTPKQHARLLDRVNSGAPGLGPSATPPAPTLGNILGYAAMPDAARLDVPAYIECSAREFATHDIVRPVRINPAEVVVASNHVEAAGLRARHLVWCGGFHDHDNPWLPDLALSPAKGEIIELQAHDHDARDFESRVVHCAGHWLVPGKEPGAMSIGATYDHQDLTPAPTAGGRNALVARAEELLSVPFSVTDHLAGIRPVSADRKPVVGRHPVHKRILVLNGLGSKGVLWAPREAERVCGMLRGTAPEGGL